MGFKHIPAALVAFKNGGIAAILKGEGTCVIIGLKKILGFSIVLYSALIPGCNKNAENVDYSSSPSQDTTLPQGIFALNDDNFSIKIFVPGRVAMVEFYSPACGACNVENTIVTQIASEYKGKALIGQINIGHNDTLIQTYAIEYWPTFIFLNAGQETRRIIGSVPKDLLTSVLDSLLLHTAIPFLSRM